MKVYVCIDESDPKCPGGNEGILTNKQNSGFGETSVAVNPPSFMVTANAFALRCLA